MFEYTVTEEHGIKWVNIKGRIDSSGSKELEIPLKELTEAGERKIAVNFEEVSYISSTGLRVFLSFQKELKKVGGEIILYKMKDYVFNVFKTAGFDRVFHIIENKEEISLAKNTATEPVEIISKEINGISLKIMEKTCEPETLFPLGSQEPLKNCEYTKVHVISVRPGDIKFGTGLASMGENYEEYKDYFGETLIVNGNLFVYPAVKRPSVDFMIYSNREETIKYHFLHGFGFKGSFKYIASFNGIDTFIELNQLIETVFKISEANMTGIVFLAESKGLWGMNLKQIPLMENKPADESNIFDSNNFSRWMNFSIEPEDINQIVIGCGIAIKDKEKEKPYIKDLIPKENNFHIHASVFKQELFRRDINEFRKELQRVMTDMEALSVKHLLGKSLFSHGMAGIIELKG